MKPGPSEPSSLSSFSSFPFFAFHIFSPRRPDQAQPVAYSSSPLFSSFSFFFLVYFLKPNRKGPRSLLFSHLLLHIFTATLNQKSNYTAIKVSRPFSLSSPAAAHDHSRAPPGAVHFGLRLAVASRPFSSSFSTSSQSLSAS